MSKRGTLTVLVRAVARRIAPSGRADRPTTASRLIPGLVVLIATASVACATNPPEVEWTREFSSFDTTCSRVIQVSSGGFAAAGRVVGNRLLSDVYLLMLNSLGETSWQRNLDIDPDNTDAAGWLEHTSDGGYIMAGIGGDSARIIVLKVDSSGNREWLFNHYAEATVNCVRQTADGGYVTGGIWMDGDSLFLLKLDSLGGVVWRRCYADTFTGWRPRLPVQTLRDGGVVLAAGAVLKADAAGNLLWRRSYDGVCVLHSIEPMNDGGFVAAGVGRPSHAWEVWKKYCMVMVRVDSLGNLVWKRVYGNGLTSAAYCVSPARDGGFLICGKDRVGGADCAVAIRTDGLGNVAWTKTLNTRDALFSGCQTRDGGYVLSGDGRRIWKLVAEQ